MIVFPLNSLKMFSWIFFSLIEYTEEVGSSVGRTWKARLACQNFFEILDKKISRMVIPEIFNYAYLASLLP